MRMRKAACAFALILVGAMPLAAQDESRDAKKPPTPEHTGIHALFRNLGQDYKNLWHLDNLLVAGVGGGAALAVHPFDMDVNAHLQSHYDALNDVYAPAKYYGGTAVQVSLSIGSYAVGRIFDMPKVSHLGMGPAARPNHRRVDRRAAEVRRRTRAAGR